MSRDESVSSAVSRSGVAKNTVEPSADAPWKLVPAGPSATEKVERAEALPASASRTIDQHNAATADDFPQNPTTSSSPVPSARSRPGVRPSYARALGRSSSAT